VVELTNVSPHGMWLLVDERELFLPFDAFPWFRKASIAQLFPWFRKASIAQLACIERPTPDHLRWPDLDVDLSIDSIDHPERYPLVSGAGAEVRESPEPE